jgi:hypothetical protein
LEVGVEGRGLDISNDGGGVKGERGKGSKGTHLAMILSPAQAGWRE